MTPDKREQLRAEITRWILEADYSASYEAWQVIHLIEHCNEYEILHFLSAPTEEAALLRDAIRNAAQVRAQVELDEETQSDAWRHAEGTLDKRIDERIEEATILKPCRYCRGRGVEPDDEAHADEGKPSLMPEPPSHPGVTELPDLVFDAPICNACLLERFEATAEPILGWEMVDGYVIPVRPDVRKRGGE